MGTFPRPLGLSLTIDLDDDLDDPADEIVLLLSIGLYEKNGDTYL